MKICNKYQKNFNAISKHLEKISDFEENLGEVVVKHEEQSKNLGAY